MALVMSVNLDGVFLGTKYGAEAMKKNGGGSIVNMSSAGGLVAPQRGGLCASKGAVRLLTKATAIEFSKSCYDYNIRVIPSTRRHRDTHAAPSSAAGKEMLGMASDRPLR